MASAVFGLRNAMPAIRRLEIGLNRGALNSTLTKQPPNFTQKITSKPLFKIVLSGGVVSLVLLYNKADCAGGDNSLNAYKKARSQRTVSKGGDGGSGTGGNSDPFGGILEKYGNELQRLGLGGIVGICAAVAMKRIGHEAAYVLGLGFLGLQALSYMGYIQIDYKKFTNDVKAKLDTDGDGKLTTKDLMHYWNKFVDIATYNVPGAGGYSAGFLIGLYMF